MDNLKTDPLKTRLIAAINKLEEFNKERSNGSGWITLAS